MRQRAVPKLGCPYALTAKSEPKSDFEDSKRGQRYSYAPHKAEISRSLSRLLGNINKTTWSKYRVPFLFAPVLVASILPFFNAW
jgi:hypothetical protein